MRTSQLAIGAFLAAAMLTACKREPTFDERYAGAKKAIRQKASELDQDMARRAVQEHSIRTDSAQSDAATKSSSTH